MECRYIDDEWPDYLRALEGATEDEAKVAWLLTWYRSQAQIATELGLSLHTVEQHVLRLRARLQVPDWREVAAKMRHVVNELRARDARGDGRPKAREPDIQRKTPPAPTHRRNRTQPGDNLPASPI